MSERVLKFKTISENVKQDSLENKIQANCTN